MPSPLSTRLPQLRKAKDFSGAVVALTGAGSGIGRALAVALASRGALLALSDITPGPLAETAELARAAGARDVLTTTVDVADRAAVEAWAAEVVAHHGRVNVLVNNAGVSLTGQFAELEHADMEWIVGINFWGVVHGTKAFLPHLIASGEGHVVTLSSLFGLLSVPGQSLYNATKYAVRGLTEALREEMLAAGHPVDVTVVHPGGIATGIVRNGRFADPDRGARTISTFDEVLARTTPEQAARTILSGMSRRKPRVLIGADAHLLHNFARFAGARYQDVVARATPADAQ
ncbi:MAG: SDR family NAD(P)-dependent oxidoreductase [Nocardioides sp.]|uniref:SDR family NAD(P)-dependent oxidoreductase n=1 Tax=Nocardioides sp. TaxID=35761 RepID=UPI003F04AFB5